MFGIPATTEFDLRFRLLGMPVRVHPLFWIISALLGYRGEGTPLRDVLIWVGCVFVSILVHEFGHALMARAFGASPLVLLYGMGGLCVYDAERQGPGRRLAVLFAGPGAGFVLAGAVFGGYFALGEPVLNEVGDQVFWNLLWINVVWGIVNLLPVWPLDGGQIAGVILTVWNRRQGMRWAHIVSVVTCGLMVLLAFRLHQLYVALLFALFAFQNMQMLQTYQYAGYGGDDADWWKR